MTDLHFNFVSPEVRLQFYTRLREEQLHAILIGGDIGEAASVTTFLAEIADALRIPIYFVLGNHDFYGGSIRLVREAVAREAEGSAWLHWLPDRGVVPLTAVTALIGHDSWADGRLGSFFRSEVMLNDYFLIADLCGVGKEELYAKLNTLGDEAARFLEKRALEALPRYKNLIVLTHVPPFRDSCWHEGRISDEDSLPHFACRAVGDRLSRVMRAHPDRTMEVLCGHTHSAGFARILENLTVRTGSAEYGSPALQRVWDTE